MNIRVDRQRRTIEHVMLLATTNELGVPRTSSDLEEAARSINSRGLRLFWSADDRRSVRGLAGRIEHARVVDGVLRGRLVLLEGSAGDAILDAAARMPEIIRIDVQNTVAYLSTDDTNPSLREGRDDTQQEATEQMDKQEIEKMVEDKIAERLGTNLPAVEAGRRMLMLSAGGYDDPDTWPYVAPPADPTNLLEGDPAEGFAEAADAAAHAGAKSMILDERALTSRDTREAAAVWARRQRAALQEAGYVV